MQKEKTNRVHELNLKWTFVPKLMGRTLSALSLTTGNQEKMFSPIIKEKYLTHTIAFVHHCKTFPNPLNFVMNPGSNLLKSFFFSFPAASMLLSPHDVMDPIWGDYGDGRRDDQGLSPRKMWISQTNHGKNDERIWLHFNLKTVWMITKLFVCVSSKKKKNKKTFQLSTAGKKTKEGGHMKGGENNDFKIHSCSIRYCP